MGEYDRSTNPDCQETKEKYYCAHDAIDVDIAAVYPHESYNYLDEDKLDDIALIKLKNAVTFTEFVKPICLPVNTDSFSTRYITDYGTPTVIGFGKTETGNSSQRLLKIEIDIVTHRECKNKYRLQGRSLQPSQICATRESTDTW